MKRGILLLAVALCCGFAHPFGWASFKVLVLDSSTSKPLSNVKVEGSLLNYSRGWMESAKNNDVDAWTDVNGEARLSGLTEKGVGGCRIHRHEGYYNARWRELVFAKRSLLQLGRWLPDDAVITVRLDRVIAPIPLYVNAAIGEYRERSPSYYDLPIRKRDFSVTNDVPVVTNEILSYDFIKGAWLPPHGNGETCDIQFVFNENVLGWKEDRGYGGTFAMKLYRITASISMPGRGNGIVETTSRENAGIRLRIAPETGYGNNLTRWCGWFGGGDGTKTDSDKNRCHAFRIRTEYDDNGRVKRAYYGKIYNDFDISSLEGVRFLYYLNPTPNDRNLEWDMKHNLCPSVREFCNPQP